MQGYILLGFKVSHLNVLFWEVDHILLSLHQFMIQIMLSMMATIIECIIWFNFVCPLASLVMIINHCSI